jgi:DNA adenine methylase
MQPTPTVANSLACEPFLRWAGGKNWFLKHIPAYLPPKFKNYHEIFLGGGSVFFNMNSRGHSFLSDLNVELIETYVQIRDNVGKVIEELKKYSNTEESYYKLRQKKFSKDYQKAARFIFLNKTSFNGIYRVNRNGEYNVPYGWRPTIDFIQEDVLNRASLKLRDCELTSSDFELSLNKVKKGDLVFIDPPYTVAHENNGFILYNQKLFSLNDQIRLSSKLKELDRLGVYFIVTNAYHKEIKNIYKGVGEFHVLTRNSLIGGKYAARKEIKEYVIKNH